MRSQHKQVRWWTIVVVLLVAMTWGTSGCGARPPRVEIVPSRSISTLEVGEKLALSADATGQELKYQWKHTGPGKLWEPATDPAVVYEATEPGDVVVTVEVTDKNGQMATKSYSFVVEPSTEVVVERPNTPTPTHTPTATSTSTPTPIDTLTPTSTPLPSPTDTPMPTFTPSPSPIPTEDIRFWADSEHVSAGSCTTVHWHVSNVNAYWVDGQPGVGDSGSKLVCPCLSQTYYLRAIKRDGSEVNLSVTINVSGQCPVQPLGPVMPTYPTMPVALITFHGRYVTAMGADRDWVIRAETRTLLDFEKFTLLCLDNGKVALETHHGRYVTATRGEPWRLRAETTELRDWEKFALVEAETGEQLLCLEAFELLGQGSIRIALKTHHDGRYVTAMNDEDNRDWVLRAETTELWDWEKFTLVPLPE